ncbi:aldehyde dehydrogenase family protein, partial [Methylobacterium sp. WL6]|uniref:aldehyde dehydrogenase family protein n=1 Tax=Methylobacterium sp. WL6 TaxID=2603901 RepID=UPI001FED4150
MGHHDTAFDASGAGRTFGSRTFARAARAHRRHYGRAAFATAIDDGLMPDEVRGILAGRVWTNCYHAYPAHAAFGGYKQSGIGRENHRMMLDHYQQTK